ncbi:MAG: TetR family transcriptional regulator, partial [Kofleriaceae bacterium]|nr:TetR family transcriptional regulator [Kofleriaceae bacterium]
MGRTSNREERRKQILQAFARVLADHGYAGATIARVAAEAELAPGLLHHHFKDKDELLSLLATSLIGGFRAQTRAQHSHSDPLIAYTDAALAVDASSDGIVPRCWVGLFAEAIRNPVLFRQFRRLIDRELMTIQKKSNGDLSGQDAAAVMAFIVGALVLGAFAPKKT